MFTKCTENVTIFCDPPIASFGNDEDDVLVRENCVGGDVKRDEAVVKVVEEVSCVATRAKDYRMSVVSKLAVRGMCDSGGNES